MRHYFLDLLEAAFLGAAGLEVVVAGLGATVFGLAVGGDTVVLAAGFAFGVAFFAWANAAAFTLALTRTGGPAATRSYSLRNVLSLLSLRALVPLGLRMAPSAKPSFFSRLPILMSERGLRGIGEVC